MNQFLAGLLKRPPRSYTETQLMFVEWNAERLGISVDESRHSYETSLREFRDGHRGPDFRAYNDRAYRIFGVLFTDAPRGVFASYQAFAPMHFLRMLSYSDPTWKDSDELVRPLVQKPFVRILDFGCGLAHRSRALARHLLRKGSRVELVLADIPTLRKDFLLWCGRKSGIETSFLDCTESAPIPDLPESDVCFAMDFFEHVHEPLRYLRRIHEAIVPGGFLVADLVDHQPEYMHVSPNLSILREEVVRLGYTALEGDSLFARSNIQ